MSSENEARALLLEQYERTMAEARAYVDRLRRKLPGAVDTAERECLKSRIARFQQLVDETQVKAERIRQALGGLAN